jgi:hypothetical protein
VILVTPRLRVSGRGGGEDVPLTSEVIATTEALP